MFFYRSVFYQSLIFVYTYSKSFIFQNVREVVRYFWSPNVVVDTIKKLDGGFVDTDFKFCISVKDLDLLESTYNEKS
jgi:hypothetical protein